MPVCVFSCRAVWARFAPLCEASSRGSCCVFTLLSSFLFQLYGSTVNDVLKVKHTSRDGGDRAEQWGCCQPPVSQPHVWASLNNNVSIHVLHMVSVTSGAHVQPPDRPGLTWAARCDGSSSCFVCRAGSHLKSLCCCVHTGRQQVTVWREADSD